MLSDEERKKKMRDYYEANKEIINEKKRAKRKDGKVQETERAYRAKNKEVLKQKRKIYLEKNKEKIAKQKQLYNIKNFDTIKKRKQAYQKSIKGQIINRNAQHERRSCVKKGDVCLESLKKMVENAKVCYWCNESLKNKQVHIDHYVPLSKGGEHTLSNLVVSCDRCNLTKNAKDPIDFANSVGKLL